MKRGSKKTDKDVAGSREPEEAGSKKQGGTTPAPSKQPVK